jgi:hypothetical protein
MGKSKSTRDSSLIPEYCFRDHTEALLEEWFSLSPDARSQKFIDTACAAEIAQVTRQTIRSWLDNGEVQALGIGRRLYVHTDSLKNWLAMQAYSWIEGEARHRDASLTRIVRTGAFNEFGQVRQVG